MPDWINIVILGIIEGITEFLPISSTGHLLIAEHWLPRQTDLFNVVIQAGAVLAVIPLFWGRFEQFIHRWREPATRDYILKIMLAFVLTCIGGYAMEKKHFKLPEELAPVAWALLVGGILFLVVEFFLRGKKLRGDVAQGIGVDSRRPQSVAVLPDGATTVAVAVETGRAQRQAETRWQDVTWAVAVAVGLGQLVAAFFPGASRSGTTILIALVLGLGRPAATEFSFLVGIPTMLAASALKIFKAFHHPIAGAPHENWGMVVLASVVAAVVSFVAVKWLLRYVQTHTFNAFGWYRIVVGGALLVFLMMSR